MAVDECSSCQYIWVATGECRRFPPTVMMTGNSQRAFWPLVADDDWCGEFQPSEVGGAIVLTSLSPNSLAAGSTPATIDVLGTGFDQSCTIYSDGTARATFFIDIGHLQFTARPDLATSGQTNQITVSNGTVTSNVLTLTFT